ncbi:hypothetical protein CDAR_239031 [Caerostris darwini]|uniref:Uncharacterized protein n=1 Tax=Caerostris darwini TaxID=1538125 RepID=A0AAV4PS08_9ARAC|nr:hypothetical protein CDAR_239031 [Caerostris darwini]
MEMRCHISMLKRLRVARRRVLERGGGGNKGVEGRAGASRGEGNHRICVTDVGFLFPLAMLYAQITPRELSSAFGDLMGIYERRLFLCTYFDL